MNQVSLWQRLGRALTGNALVSAPAVWGKLPVHGDFVHHRCPAVERDAWHAWVNAIWPSRPPALRDKSARSQAGWITLDAPRPERRWQDLPVAFVLPPGALPFAPAHHVQGVLTPSVDKVGRSCPFIVYQQASRAWVQRQWTAAHAQDGRHMLFWWSRLVLRAVQGDALPQWLQRLDAMWVAQAPGWAQWLGAPPARMDNTRMQDALGQLPQADPAQDLRGVYHLPWADWPQRCWDEPPAAAFWTQDAQGGYVQAANSLQQLWGRA